MICYCDYCHYTFDSMDCHSKDSIPDRCPDCGKAFTNAHVPAVREANKDETAEYQRIRIEISKEDQE